MIEKEYKSMIDKAVYDKIDAAFGWDTEVCQTNTYYTDENGVLSGAGVMLRIREREGVYKVQVKSGKTTENALRICREDEFDTDSAPEIIRAADAFRYTGYDTGDLKRIGALVTLRKSCFGYEGAEICLDESVYFGKHDFEIEVEYTKEPPEEILKRLEALGVSFDKPVTGKYARFLTARKENTEGGK